MTPGPADLRADVLARLLLIQSTAGQFAEAAPLVAFVCRGLEQLPGISEARFMGPADDRVTPEAGALCLPVQYGTSRHGEIILRLADPEVFLPYEPHVANLVFMVAIMLQERRQQALVELQQRQLEVRVEERTRQLSLEVSERRAAEATAVAAKQRAEAYLDIAEAIIVELDEQGRIAVLNKRGCDLLGVSVEEAIGHDWFELAIPPEDRGSMRAVFGRLLRGEAVLPDHVDNTVLSRSGERRVLTWHNTVRREHGKVVGTLSSGLDITERLQMLEELLRAEKLDAVGVLAGGIAHDFNNLLGGIFGFIEAARAETDPSGPAAEALDESLQVLDRARDLTRQLLTFSKGGAPVRKVVELGPLVTQAVQFALSGSAVSCQMHIAPDLPRAEVDAGQISQVIDNLVRNALQAMPGGGVLTVSGTGVCLQEGERAPRAAGRYACITIRDSGTGIAPEVLPRIFDPFFTTKGGGSGLGLATAYSIVHKHLGSIDAESKLGMGSAFRIFLPAASEVAATAPALAPTPHAGGGSALVLDDEPSLRRAFTRMLARMGYQVTAVGTGEEAIEATRASVASGEPFTLAIMDLTIVGGMGGKEAIVEIRRLAPHLLAIASSGYSNDPVIARPRDFGFTASLGKPFTASELAQVLSQTSGAPAQVPRPRKP